jgi:steroid delta-isomerase-like uncharacterized protein
MRRSAVFLSIALLLIAAGCGSPEDRSKTQNIEAVRLVFHEVFSKGNVDLVDELYAAEFVGHFPAETFHGPEGIRSHVIAHRTAFPDWREEIEDLIVERDRVVARFTSRGTNLGAFLDKPPTGNRVEISEVAIFRLQDGKIVEQWVYPDILSMQRQLRGERQR